MGVGSSFLISGPFPAPPPPVCLTPRPHCSSSRVGFFLLVCLRMPFRSPGDVCVCVRTHYRSILKDSRQDGQVHRWTASVFFQIKPAHKNLGNLGKNLPPGCSTVHHSQTEFLSACVLPSSGEQEHLEPVKVALRLLLLLHASDMINGS